MRKGVWAQFAYPLERAMAWLRTSGLLDSIWQYGPATPKVPWLPGEVELAMMAVEEQVDRFFAVVFEIAEKRRSS